MKDLTSTDKDNIERGISYHQIKRIDSIEALFKPYTSKATLSNTFEFDKKDNPSKKFKLFKNLLGKNLIKSCIFSFFSMLLLSLMALCFMFISFSDINASEDIIKNSSLNTASLVAHKKVNGECEATAIQKLTDKQEQFINQYESYYIISASVGTNGCMANNGSTLAPQHFRGGLYASSPIGSIVTNLDFIQNIFFDGKEADIEYADEIKKEGVYITDFTYDSIKRGFPGASRKACLGSTSLLHGYVNGIINTDYYDKFSTVFTDFCTDNCNIEDYEKVYDYISNYLSYTYVLEDYETFKNAYIESSSYNAAYNSFNFSLPINDTNLDVTIGSTIVASDSIDEDTISFSYTQLNKLTGASMDANYYQKIIGDGLHEITFANCLNETITCNLKIKLYDNSNIIAQANPKLIQKLKGNNVFKFGALFKNKNDATKLFNANKDSNLRFVSLKCENSLRLKTNIAPYKNLFAMFGVLLIFLSVLSIFYISYSSVKSNHYNIGVLKAIGMSSRNLYHTYFINLFFQAMFCLFFYTIFIFSLAKIANNILVSSIAKLFEETISFLNITIFDVTNKIYFGFLLLIAVILSLGMLIPIFKIKKINPIDIIRNKY